MQKQNVSEQSLRDHVLDSIGNFLYKENFPKCDITPMGIMNLVDLISNYHEEGKELFPEIIVTSNINKILEALPFARKINISSSQLSIDQFSRSLKLCAPLAKDGWILFLELKGDQIEFGLISAEISEISPSFYSQIIGDLSMFDEKATIAYIKNIGTKTVLVEGKSSKLIINLSLKDHSLIGESKIAELCKMIVKDLSEEIREMCFVFFEKLLPDSIKESHGTLIAIVEDNIDRIASLKSRIEDGVYLHEPIDLVSHIEVSESEKTRESSTSVKVFATLIKSMICHDGITIFTSKGKLVGYHCFVKPEDKSECFVVGGARTRAFEAMKNSGLFCCCFYKSQDGHELIWRENDN